MNERIRAARRRVAARSMCAKSSRRAASRRGWSRITRCRSSAWSSRSAAARRRTRPARRGAATIMSGLLDEGAGDLDSQAFHRALDEKAIEIGFHADRDKVSGRMRTLARTPRPRRRAAGAGAQRAALRRGAVRARARADQGASAPRDERSQHDGVARLSRPRFRRPPLRAPERRHGRKPRRARARRHGARSRAHLLARDALHVAIVGAIDAERARRG